MCEKRSRTKASRWVSGCCWSSEAPSSATLAASCAGVRGAVPKIRSVSQRKRSPCASSSTASIAMKPNAIFQYRLRYQTGSDIGELVSRAPHGQHESRLGGVLFHFSPPPLHHRRHAPLRDVGVPPPPPL